MKIGVLTFLHVANFGANLQATSTYCYLKNQGHIPVFINYTSYQVLVVNAIAKYKRKLLHRVVSAQTLEHERFICEQIKKQTRNVHTCSQVFDVIKEEGIEAIIIGSDAVAQHWPLFSTLKLGKHRPFWIEPLQQERRFPNPFWGVGFSNKIPTAMMSVSSQNSKYHIFTKTVLKRIAKQIDSMTYISVRDAWTKDMMLAAQPSRAIEVTPDPVFALNYNLGDLIPSENDIRSRFRLPKHYVLVGLRSQVYSYEELSELNELFKQEDKECVAFNIDGVYAYKHPFSYEIPLPLNPLDWFALIKFASAYIGSNMHPIVSSLTNGVPCFSIDNWGVVDFWGNKKSSNSSKVYDILSQYDLTKYWSPINKGRCAVSVYDIVNLLRSFPVETVKETSKQRVEKYKFMMESIFSSFEKDKNGK